MDASNDKPAAGLTYHVDPIEHGASGHDIAIQLAELDNGEIAIEALGGTVSDLPSGYYRSFSFLGTVLALCLGQICCYFGFVLPANVLTLINEDIGPDPQFVWTAMIVS